MAKKKIKETKLVRVIRDSRDYRLDYFLPEHEARALYLEGKLAYDQTNRSYSH